MKKILLCLLAIGIVGIAEAKALIDPQLDEIIAKTRGDAQIEVMIVFDEQSNEDYLRNLVADLPRREQRYPVVNYLKELSARTQSPLLDYLNLQTRSNKVSEIKSFWIINAVSCKATTEVINEIANRENVSLIAYPYAVSEDILLTYGEPVPVDILDYRTKEWHVSKVAADSCWTAGYRGQGVIVGLIDTGCNYNHLDLTTHMWICGMTPITQITAGILKIIITIPLMPRAMAHAVEERLPQMVQLVIPAGLLLSVH